jgi:L-aminopeptidase/D-esterase-like protein
MLVEARRCIGCPRMSTAPLPDGFSVGHWTDAGGLTGCTVVIAPPGARGAVEIRGGGASTRETDSLGLLANAEGPTAVLMTGGSAFGLAAADGVVRWLEERGLGRPTPFGPIPLVPTAVVFDLVGHGVRPGPDGGYAACEAASPGVPARGLVGAGAGTAVGKTFGRERASAGGVGHAAMRLQTGTIVAAVAVANSVGDVIGADGAVIGGPRGDDGRLLRTSEVVSKLGRLPDWEVRPGEHTTLACVCTDAPLDKRGCGIVARMATAGLARAVDPAFSPIDGDVIFCVASGSGPVAPAGLEATLALTAIGSIAATVTAEAIRDAVRASARGDQD